MKFLNKMVVFAVLVLPTIVESTEFMPNRGVLHARWCRALAEDVGIVSNQVKIEFI